ncbi:MAG: hypothetical protein IJ938_02680, partial [Clostridia bacterium]|nr:hypothetical protein [Clostridia bacterium]
VAILFVPIKISIIIPRLIESFKTDKSVLPSTKNPNTIAAIANGIARYLQTLLCLGRFLCKLNSCEALKLVFKKSFDEL